MRSHCVIASLAAGLILPLSAQAPNRAVVAIRNVTTVPVAGEPAANQTVVVIDGRIRSIGPADATPVPAGARVVDGTGRYLIPGLIDLHVHLSKARASALGLFIANGVTTLRDMGGDHDELLRWRDDIRRGVRVGPEIRMAGPYLESASNVERMRKDPPAARVEPFERTRIPIGSPADARRVIAALAAKEVDFLKIRTVQDRQTYLAINETARLFGLTVVGHVSGIEPAVVLEAGQDGVDHWFYPSLATAVREERLAVWRQFAARRIPVVPTLIVVLNALPVSKERLNAIVNDEEGKIEPRRRYISRFMVLDWREQVQEVSDERRAALKKAFEVVMRDLREMHEAGVDVLAGSDTAVLNIYPGWSLHEELEVFVREIGMSPAEALDRATRRSAMLLKLDNNIGTIERGKVADLVLLDGNPLEDIRNTRRISAVLRNGRVYDSAALKGLLSEVSMAADRKTDDWGRTATRAIVKVP